MFSSIMETVLTKFLGSYVDGLKNNMDVNIITGNATIQKISLRPQFINSLGLPFLLKYSHISKILVNVPWANIKQKPTTVTVQGLYVLLSLKYDDEEFDIEPAKKIKPLISRVKQQIKKKWQQKQTNKSQTFAEKSIIRIIDNLVINIDQIHVRVQSIKRGWDFSLGVVMDKISSFTVNQYGQKTFYTRHFTNKQSNPPLKKSFTCERFQLYFNDQQDFFMCDKTKNQEIKTLLMEPFASKTLNSPIKKKQPISNQKISTVQTKQSYKMKNLTRFSFDIIAQQKLSADKKYIVQVKGQLPKINFMISDIQLSQILVVLQLIYEWVIDREKNGRRNNNFNQKIQIQFKKILKKLAKQDKTTPQQIQSIYRIASQTPVDKLQNAADNLIKQQRIDKQMKKINKVANKQKSKQMIQKLLERVDNENQQVLQLFEHIIIELNIPQFKLSCMQGNSALLQIGVNSIMSDIKLVLTKHTLVSIYISEPFIREYHEGQVKNLVILNKPQYSKQPFAQFSLTLLNKSPPIIKANLRKRYIQLHQLTLSNLIKWISCIKLKPPILNFLDQQLNYSIHITQQIFGALFNHADLSINVHMQIPVLAIKLQNILIQYDMGTMEIKRQNQQEYCIDITEKQSLQINGEQIFSFDQGSRISLLNIKPQTVKIQLCGFHLKNVPKVFKFVSQIIQNQLIGQIKKLQLTVEQQTIFQGKFLLNQYITPQNMLLKGNYLKFLPSGDSIYLLRTKMYPFEKKGRYGLIFRQEVQKIINIVLMDSQKTMNTLFQTIRDYMLKICTISQWKKYYQKFPNQILTSISQIQGQQQNNSLIDLHIVLGTANILLNYSNTSSPLLINLGQLKNTINYKQYNTAAQIDVGCFNFVMGKQKLIENLSIGLQYEYKDYLNLGLSVRQFRLNIDTYDVINQIVNQLTQYSLMFANLMKNVKQVFPPPPISEYVQQKAPSNQDISYLLQRKFSFKIANTQAYVIGFRNLIKHSTLQLCKYRNTPTPNIILQIRQVVLMSSITLTSCDVNFNPNKIDINVLNLGINLSFQLIFYELTTGRGNYFLNSIKNLVQAQNKIQKKVNNSSSVQQKSLPAITLNIKGIKTRFKVIQSQQISTYIRNAVININKNEQNKNLMVINATWNKLGLIINNNVVLQPISGKVLVNANKQFIPFNVFAQVEPIVINISVHKLLQSAIVIKISLQHLLNIQLIKNMLAQTLIAKNPRLQQKKQTQPQLKLNIKSIKAILYNAQDMQLLRLKIDTINLDTGKNKDNQISVSLQHLNNYFRIYQPILQKTKIIMAIKQGPQACIKFTDIRVNISEQFVKDIIKQLLITKQNIEQSLKQTKYINLHQQSHSNQLQKYKSIIISMIMPQSYQVDEQQQQQNQQNKQKQNKYKQKQNVIAMVNQKQQVNKSQQQKSNTSILKIRNYIKAQVLLQIKIDEDKIKKHLKDENDQSQITFNVKSDYKQSYQMVEKYKQIIIKISLINSKFYTQSLYFTVFLHKTAYNYHQTKFYDEFNQQIQSAIGIYIHQQQNSNNYIMDIISAFKIINTTTITLNLNWIKGQQHYHRQLSQGEQEWVSPWINDKVTINPNSDHLFASSYQILFDQPHGLYQISLNKSVVAQQHNFCCLTIQRQLFDLQKWHSKQQHDVHKNKNLKIKRLQPAILSIKPTYFVINHFHSPVNINGTQCKHKQKIPLYSMFRSKKNEQFFKIKFGDGSMHQIYLPKDGHTSTVQLKLKNQNYITISIHRNKSLQGTNNPNSNQCIYHLFCQLQLLISFPKQQQLILKTNILSTKYILKKQLELNQVLFQHVHPALIAGHENVLLRDRFHFHTDVHLLGQFEKYLEIKSVSGFYSKQVTLYPSYYGNDIHFYKQKPQQKQKQKQKQNQPIAADLIKKFSITYQSTKISQQITMFYVSILPKYYILNLSQQNFNIDGQGILKFNQRIAVDSDQIQIVYLEQNSRWQMLHNSLVINLSMKKQIVFFKQILFEQHQINHHLKRKRKMSKQGESMMKKQQKNNQNKQKKSQQKNKYTISTENMKIFQVLKHIGSFSATTFCLKPWNQWLNIHNNLNKIITVATTYKYQDLQISIQTIIKPGQAANHPYGLQNLPDISFYVENIDKKKDRIQLGTYQTNLRFNDQIQLTIPQDNEHKAKIQLIVMYQVRSKSGRKIIFSFANNGQQQIQSSKKIRSLILPAFLKISESLKVTIQNFNTSVIIGQGKNRRELIRLNSNSIDFLLLAYPSGLYMIQTIFSLQLEAPQFPQPVLNIPNIQFYLQAVQQKFIQRVTFKVSKQLTVLLTDKLIYQFVDVITKNMKQINSQKKVIQNQNDAAKLVNDQQTDVFYTSTLNSISISEIHAKVTVKKVLIQNLQHHKKLLDMGLSIIQLQGSGIKLPKIDIQQPVNSLHIDGITKKYVMEIIIGCLGGMNLIGNPKQFMEEIQAGTSRGKPVIGLFGGIIAGTTNSMSKILSTVGNSVSQLSMDYQYHQQRNQIYMNQPKGFANGVKQGGKSLFSSVKSGVVGLYKRPKQGLEEQGGIGLIKGTFSGLAGVLVKSVTGVIDAASMTVKGLKSASSYNQNNKDKKSYLQKPLYHKFKIIRPYDKIDELGFNNLMRIFRQQKFNCQTIDIVQAFVVQGLNGKQANNIVVITSDKLYVINLQQDQIQYQIPNEKLNATGKFQRGVVLYYNLNQEDQQNQRDIDYDPNRDNGEQMVFGFKADEMQKKQKLYWTLKAFVDLYAQSKDKQIIPQ